jgi:hypothetical protein
MPRKFAAFAACAAFLFVLASCATQPASAPPSAPEALLAELPAEPDISILCNIQKAGPFLGALTNAISADSLPKDLLERGGFAAAGLYAVMDEKAGGFYVIAHAAPAKSFPLGRVNFGLAMSPIWKRARTGNTKYWKQKNGNLSLYLYKKTAILSNVLAPEPFSAAAPLSAQSRLDTSDHFVLLFSTARLDSLMGSLPELPLRLPIRRLSWTLLEAGENGAGEALYTWKLDMETENSRQTRALKAMLTLAGRLMDETDGFAGMFVKALREGALTAEGNVLTLEGPPCKAGELSFFSAPVKAW